MRSITPKLPLCSIRKGDPYFLNWLNVFVAQVKTDGTLDLLRYEYFDQMAWAIGGDIPEERLSTPEFLKYRFMVEKRIKIEKRRTMVLEKGANYQ
jgi:hypothetical protein